MNTGIILYEFIQEEFDMEEGLEMIREQKEYEIALGGEPWPPYFIYIKGLEDGFLYQVRRTTEEERQSLLEIAEAGASDELETILN